MSEATKTPTLVYTFNPVYDMSNGKALVMLDVLHCYSGKRGHVDVPYESWKHRDEILVFKEDVTWID